MRAQLEFTDQIETAPLATLMDIASSAKSSYRRVMLRPEVQGSRKIQRQFRYELAVWDLVEYLSGARLANYSQERVENSLPSRLDHLLDTMREIDNAD